MTADRRLLYEAQWLVQRTIFLRFSERLFLIHGLSGIHLSSGSIVLFADDLLLHRKITCLKDFVLVQNDIDELCTWLSSHKLMLNSRKCKSLLISRKRLPTDSPILYVGGSALERVSGYKYLGIVISSDLSWSNHIKGIASKARKQIGLLYRWFYKHAHQDTLRALYVALIRPHLEYGVPVWDSHLLKDINVLEAVQRFATKVCVKSWNTLDYQERLDKLHLDTLQKRRSVSKLCHLFKAVHGLSNFPNSPIDFAVPSRCSTRSNHNLLLNVPFAYSNSYSILFCDAPRLLNTLPHLVLSLLSLIVFKVSKLL